MKGAQEDGWINSTRARPKQVEGFYESTLSFKNLQRETSGKFRCTFHYKRVDSWRDDEDEGNFSAAYEMNVLGNIHDTITT